MGLETLAATIGEESVTLEDVYEPYLMIASDIPAILALTKKYIVLGDGEVAKLTPAGVTVYNQLGDEVQKEISTVTWDVSAAEKGGYEHFMFTVWHMICTSMLAEKKTK